MPIVAMACRVSCETAAIAVNVIVTCGQPDGASAGGGAGGGAPVEEEPDEGEVAPPGGELEGVECLGVVAGLRGDMGHHGGVAGQRAQAGQVVSSK